MVHYAVEMASRAKLKIFHRLNARFLFEFYDLLARVKVQGSISAGLHLLRFNDRSYPGMAG